VLTDADLAGVDMSAADLAGIQSGGITADDAPAVLPTNWKFIAGYLVGPNANLDGADLGGANLSDLDLGYVTMNGANLADANLAGAEMATTSLGAVRSGGITGTPASLPASFVLLGGYIIGPGVNLTKADLASRNLDGLDISQATLADADLAKAQLSGTKLNSSDLVGADLKDAELANTDLSEADLTGDNLSGLAPTMSDFSYASLKGVNFTDADLSGNTLTGANLTGATLTGLKSGGVLGEPSYLPANWSAFYGYLIGPGADLAGVSLHNDVLANLDLAEAPLTPREPERRQPQQFRSHRHPADWRQPEQGEPHWRRAGSRCLPQWSQLVGCHMPGCRGAGKHSCFSSSSQHVPGLSVTVRVGPPTTALQVAGSGFKARERVTIYFGSRSVKVIQTSKSGHLGPVTVSVPGSELPGLLEIVARAAGKQQSASA
jgi:uncharacterized protein YjbI with pentapeptide repeats